MKKKVNLLLFMCFIFLIGAKAQNLSLHQLQQDFVDLRFGMFIHFNMPTYTDADWPDPNASPELFNPTKLDCRQWAKAAKSANMSYGCLTTKHHSGFCIWNTKTTDYNVMSSPFKRDVVKEYADAFRAEGLKVMIPFEDIYRLVKSIQPNCLVMDLNAAKYPAEGLFYTDIKSYEQGAGQHIEKDSNRLPALSCLPLQANWFWKTSFPKNPVKNPAKMVNDNIIPMGKAYCNFILNVAPNRDGLMDDNALEALKESDIKLSIDTSKYTTEGEYNVPVDVTLPDGYELVENVTVRVTLTPSAERQTEE